MTVSEFQSTPTARGATGCDAGLVYYRLISIHAPREGGRRDGHMRAVVPVAISIHAPREGATS